MTFENLFANLKDAQHSVSLAYHQLEMAESMATVRPCPLVEKSIATYEAAVDKVSEIRAEMGKFNDAELKRLDERAGIKRA